MMMEILVKNILVKKNKIFSTYIKNGKQIFQKNKERLREKARKRYQNFSEEEKD